jgi:hypothetical protein
MMKNTNRRRWAIAAGALLAASATACDNSKLPTINQNPNAPTSGVPASTLFTNAVPSAVGVWLGSGYDLRDISLLIQHFAENQYIGNDQYRGVNATSLDFAFSDAYENSLADFQVVVHTGQASNDPSLTDPALIMQQWEFGYLTDTWGDVPYFQALAADSSVQVLQPKLDPQQQIYGSMFAKLSKAATELAATSKNTLGAADPIYGGDPAQWAKFANSLLARDALRIVNADPTTANNELTTAFTEPGGVFTSNADNAQLNWPGDGVFNNPWAVNFASRDDDRMSKTLIDTLNSYNDPRVAIFAMPAQATGLYAGQPNGLTNADAVAYSDTASRPGAIFYPGAVAYSNKPLGGSGNSQPSYLMTYAELEFIKAEAAERGLGGLPKAEAATDYYNGIRASMEQWGVTDQAAISAYIAQPQVAYQGGTPGLKQIALQKWIALYSDGGQAWFEWRRTCTPDLQLAVVHAFPYIPRRVLYPTSEQSANGANVAAAMAAAGGTYDNSTPVWWDQKANAPTCQ